MPVYKIKKINNKYLELNVPNLRVNAKLELELGRNLFEKLRFNMKSKSEISAASLQKMGKIFVAMSNLETLPEIDDLIKEIYVKNHFYDSEKLRIGYAALINGSPKVAETMKVNLIDTIAKKVSLREVSYTDAINNIIFCLGVQLLAIKSVMPTVTSEINSKNVEFVMQILNEKYSYQKNNSNNVNLNNDPAPHKILSAYENIFHSDLNPISESFDHDSICFLSVPIAIKRIKAIENFLKAAADALSAAVFQLNFYVLLNKDEGLNIKNDVAHYYVGDDPAQWIKVEIPVGEDSSDDSEDEGTLFKPY